MTTFYFVRHGQTGWNADKNRYCGRSDIALSELGKKQAEMAAGVLKDVHFDAAYSSTLCRAYDTANILLKGRNLPVFKDPRLVETDFGRWEGERLNDFTVNYADNWSAWLEDPGHVQAGIDGENATQVFRRFHACIDELAEKHPDESVLVVAHSMSIRFFIAGTLEVPFKNYRMIPQDNTGITIMEKSSADTRFLAINLNTHLAALKK
ncbi:histidine phosphatase family protein [Heyndrickxia acidiproducens]|uniref:histidine phosphatase family protein n=1 Tax=Heyndrickxia acidiproducens TaxID=1121084 RepID=UPI00037AAF4D|nr:histidine phosphatase family protein [Heyndrickxia acidiproducens]